MQRKTGYAAAIMYGAKNNNQRTGQWLFNNLPDGATAKVVSTLFDPFHKDFNRQELEIWLEDHLIFDQSGYEIIGLYNNNEILWYRA